MAKKGQGNPENLNNAQKRDYLASRGVHITSDNSTYVQRIYSNVRKQEAANLKPSLELARRGTTAFKYIPKRQKNGKPVLPRFAFQKGEVQDVEAFLKASKQDKFTFIVTGKANADSPKRKHKRDISKPITLGLGPVSRQQVQEAIDQADDMTELINYLSPHAKGFEGLEWDLVDSVSILRNN